MFRLAVALKPSLVCRLLWSLTMLSSVALRAQIASIIDALSKAAVAEIAKVVEDGVLVLRLEACQRESEIKKLKSDIEVLHGELRTSQERATLHPDGEDLTPDTPGHTFCCVVNPVELVWDGRRRGF